MVRRPQCEFLEDRLAPATITVNTAADDLTPNDGTVSLREAITAINAGNDLGDPDITAQNPGVFGTNDTINFDIPGAGVQIIQVGGSGPGGLPAIIKPVFINGYSQPGSRPNTLANGDNAQLLIELDGSLAGGVTAALTISAGGDGSTIQGLVINQWLGVGIELESNGNVVVGNFIGTDATGTTALGNDDYGVVIGRSNPAASNNTIGGTVPSARNVISANSSGGIGIYGSGNIAEGNFIGTDANGSSLLAAVAKATAWISLGPTIPSAGRSLGREMSSREMNQMASISA